MQTEHALGVRDDVGELARRSATRCSSQASRPVPARFASATKTSRLSSNRSGTASMAIAASLCDGIASLQRIRSTADRSPIRCASRSRYACALARAPRLGLDDLNGVSACAATRAMPAPIVPPPTTNKRSIIRAPSRKEPQTLRRYRAAWRNRLGAAVRRNYVVDSPYMRLRADEVELPDGTIVRELLRSRVAGIRHDLCADAATSELCLVRQYRYGTDAIHLELPAGMLLDDEEPGRLRAARARRGDRLWVERCDLLGEYFPEPVRSTARAYIYIGRGARNVASAETRPDRAPRSRARLSR